MILKILDKKQREPGFVYIDEIDSIKVFWDNTGKFHIDENGLITVTIDGVARNANELEHFQSFVDVQTLLESSNVPKNIAGAKIIKKNKEVLWIAMDPEPLAFLMNDSGKTIERLQKK